MRGSVKKIQTLKIRATLLHILGLKWNKVFLDHNHQIAFLNKFNLKFCHQAIAFCWKVVQKRWDYKIDSNFYYKRIVYFLAKNEIFLFGHIVNIVKSLSQEHRSRHRQDELPGNESYMVCSSWKIENEITVYKYRL